MSLEQKLTALAEAIGTDVKALQQGKAETDHNHDDRYFTKTEVNTISEMSKKAIALSIIF
jgi:hypothetical protein